MYAKLVILQIIAYFGRMKNQIKVLLLFGLVIGMSSVVFSTENKPTKIDISSVADNPVVSGDYLITPVVVAIEPLESPVFVFVTVKNEELANVVNHIDSFGLLAPVPISNKNWARVPDETAINYKSPDIDRKWIWFYTSNYSS